MTENYIKIDGDVCKGCKVCVEACPKHCIVIGAEINTMGYQFAKFDSPGCVACGICFYVCPEPETITVCKDDEEEEK